MRPRTEDRELAQLFLDGIAEAIQAHCGRRRNRIPDREGPSRGRKARDLGGPQPAIDDGRATRVPRPDARRPPRDRVDMLPAPRFITVPLATMHPPARQLTRVIS